MRHGFRLKPNLEEGTYWIPAAKAGTPKLTREEIYSLKGYPQRAKREISVLYEALSFIHLTIEPSSGNRKNRGPDGKSWQYPMSAELAIEKGEANCAASANIINYLLEDDYDEVGFYWMHSDYDIKRPGGHIVNYIKEGNTYYSFDPVALASRLSHYPVEDGELSGYFVDYSAHVIQAEPRKYAIYWLQRSRRDQAIFAKYSTPGDAGTFAIGSNSGNLYYPSSFDGSRMTIWKDPNETVELKRAKYDPVPPKEYEEYAPYNSYNGSTGSKAQGNPKIFKVPSDN